MVIYSVFFSIPAHSGQQLFICTVPPPSDSIRLPSLLFWWVSNGIRKGHAFFFGDKASLLYASTPSLCKLVRRLILKKKRISWGNEKKIQLNKEIELTPLAFLINFGFIEFLPDGQIKKHCNLQNQNFFNSLSWFSLIFFSSGYIFHFWFAGKKLRTKKT